MLVVPFALSDNQVDSFAADGEIVYGHGLVESEGGDVWVIPVFSLDCFIKIDANKG